MRYPSKRDMWVACLVVPVGLLALGLATFFVVSPPRGAPVLLVIGMAALFALVGLLLLWIWFGTSYEITTAYLVARVGPIRCTIPLDAIVEVIPTRKFFVVDMNLALSLDRIRIRYRRKNGKEAPFPIAVSPQDQDGFLEELARALPGVRVVRGPG